MRMWSGRAFQVAGPACENARSVVPRSHVLIFGPSFSGPALSVVQSPPSVLCRVYGCSIVAKLNYRRGHGPPTRRPLPTPIIGDYTRRLATRALVITGRPAGRSVSLQNVWCRGMRKCGNVSVDVKNAIRSVALITEISHNGWLGSRVVSVLDSGAEGPRLKSQSRRCRVTVFGKLFTPIVPLFTKQRNW